MVALIIIYNHKFDKNIPILEDLYGERFKKIYHIVPFYTGTKDNVITVYEHSYYFQGYIANAYQILKTKGDFNNYLFIGDDLLLHPDINENNYKLSFCLNDQSSFFSNFRKLSDMGKWPHLRKALNYTIDQEGLEIKAELPNKEFVLQKLKENGIDGSYIRNVDIYDMPKKDQYSKSIIGWIWYLKDKMKMKKIINGSDIELVYPLAFGYSDIMIVPKSIIKEFCHLCGVFAAGNLFVELAIPTAMAISSKEVITLKDINKKCILLWDEERNTFDNKYERSISKLYKEFPENTLYIHPVKLSKWSKN